MTGNNFQIHSAAVSDRGLSRKRPQNEDSFLEINDRGLFAVADGVGGAQAGDVASQMAVEILGEAFANLRENSDAEELMRLAIERANRSIYQMSHDLPQLATMATTMVALHISGNIATIGHVGDSRLYRLDTKGNLHRETQDHSVVEEEVRAGRMTIEQAANHPSRNVISRALGADATVEVDMKTIMFELRTTFLLCSDGITRHIEDTEIRELLLSGDAPANIALKMKEICYERGAEDNLTAVIAKVSDSVAGQLSTPLSPGEPIAMHTAELEEPTVATARHAALIVENSSQDAPAAEEVFTAPLSRVTENRAHHEFVSSTETLVPESTPVDSVPVLDERKETIERKEPIIENAPVIKTETAEKKDVLPVAEVKTVEPKTFSNADEGSSGFLGKILSAAMWLILGGILGAGLYYLFLQNNKTSETPVITQAQPPNIEYTAFESNRRIVDKNPRQFIQTNAVPPGDAEGAYLLGRAYLLNGQFPEAKQMFLQAKDRLAQSKETNSKVVANDIETGLIIVNVPGAQEEFKRSMNLTGEVNMSGSNSLTNTGANLNANTITNTNSVNMNQ